MHAPAPSPDDPTQRHALPLIRLLVSIAFVAVLLPFYGAVLWAVIVALLFEPVQRRLVQRLDGRRTPATLLTMAGVLLIVVIPFALVTSTLAREAAQLYQQVQSGGLNPGLELRRAFDALPGWFTALLQRFGLGDFDALQRGVTSALTQASKLLATHAVSLGQDTLNFVVGLFVMLYLAFFLLRDGRGIFARIKACMPLPRWQQDELADRVRAVMRATVKGTLIVAAVQGALGGLAFWALGVHAPLLWAVLMALLSLVPAVGAALVWLPVALFLLAGGQTWQGVVLIAYGALVIGLVDNFLRPILVGKDAQMPDYLVLVTTLGGIALVGINGFVVGPLVAALFMAVWQLNAQRAPTAAPADPPGAEG